MSAGTKIKGVVSLLTVVGVAAAMVAIPVTATAQGASNNAWQDSGEVLGSYPDQQYDRRATIEVSGRMNSSGFFYGANCDVVAEFEVWNEWPNGEPDNYHSPSWLDTPAQIKVTSFELADTAAESCAPRGGCDLSDFRGEDLPWVGVARDGIAEPEGMRLVWESTACPASGFDLQNGTLPLEPNQTGCIDSFEGTAYWMLGVSFYYTFDVEAINGLADDPPCLQLW